MKTDLPCGPLVNPRAQPDPPSDPPVRFAVLGAGTWGLTLAQILAENGHVVRCWDIDAEHLARMARDRAHPRIEGLRLDDTVELAPDLPSAVAAAQAVVFAVPSRAMRETCRALQGLLVRPTAVVCTKGLDPETHRLMHEVLAEELGPAAAARTGVLSGPSHAEEVARRLPTTLVAAGAADVAAAIQRWFFRPYLRVYTSDDPAGVALGGAVKNVIAIGAGIAEGMGFGDNTRAALMTRGLAETVRLGLAAGARRETFMGLSGIGDLIVTAGSRHSRNYRFGRLLGEGSTADDALREIGMVVEGVPTAEAVCALAAELDVEMPICEAVYRVLFQGLAPREAVESLLSRDPKPEAS